MSKTSPARKARLRARHQAEAAEELRKCMILKADGHSCATCDHSRHEYKALYCMLDSDFYGNAVVRPEFVCSRFDLRRAAHAVGLEAGTDTLEEKSL